MNFICTFGFFVVTLQPKVAKTSMTNTDFWKHIDTIIAQGYDARGLEQLEQIRRLNAVK